MPQLAILPAARNDLFEQAGYYDAQGGDALGDRFLALCEAGFERLLAFPESGAPVRLGHARLTRVLGRDDSSNRHPGNVAAGTGNDRIARRQMAGNK